MLKEERDVREALNDSAEGRVLLKDNKARHGIHRDSVENRELLKEGTDSRVLLKDGAEGRALLNDSAEGRALLREGVEGRVLLRFEDVSFSREQLPVLKHLSFSVTAGEFLAVIGPNGVGKTTLLKLANGLYHPTEGAVYLDDRSTADQRTSRIARTVGFLFQNPDRQLFSDTAEKEIAFGLKLHGLSEARIKARTDEVMRDFGLEAGINPLQAGRSLRQITALASLVAARPRLLLLDEPTTGLDFTARQRVMDIVSRLNKTEGTAVVMISHDMELVSAFASRVLVLCDGRLLADGDTRRILRDEALLAQASLAPPQALGLLNRLRDVTRAETMDELLEDIIRHKQRRRGA